MVVLFDFLNYREYLERWIDSQGSQGYGLKGKIARALGISSSLISQILKGEKTLTPDQASDLVDFLSLSEIEGDYLHLLVERDRAASTRYRKKLERKMILLRERSQKIGQRVPRQKELTDEQKATYYSSWLYTGLRNLTAVPGLNSVAALAARVQLEPEVVTRVIRFLIENGLVKEGDEGLIYGPASTHVDRESPFVNEHHRNWRLQAMQKMETRRDRDLYFTSPMSLSREAAEEIRRLLPTVIDNVFKISGPSPSETVMCLNVDWFEY